ncbi:MAG TPA: cation:proton antiporter [Gemmataceae bacterium]|nr:cation:proton antiporter [Gemmataceae bacterium]
MAAAAVPSRLRTAIGYAVLLGVGVGAFLLIRAFGETLAAPPSGRPPTAGGEQGGASHADLFHILLALAAVIAAGQGLGRLFRWFSQPPVVGEVIAGILLGPTLLGRISPDAYHYLLPESVTPQLEAISQLGLVLYMFLVGLDLNASLLRRRAHATVAISHASIVCPFVLGSVLALWLYPRVSSADVPFTVFALFMGAAMSITAFPVLARILTDRGLTRTELGAVALTCAAADDVTAWCLLALLVGVAQAQVSGLWLALGGAAAYFAFLFLVARPIVERLTARFDRGRLSAGVVALVFVGLLLSALATEAIGVHALFGAFLFGAVIPRESTIAREFTRRMSDLVTVFLLPAFFALTGMRAFIDFGLDSWLLCGVITLAATVGKFGGTFGAARLTGLSWRTSASLGVLMNTRGLMELIVLHIGLNLKVISPGMFATMVVMALATTIAATPLLRLTERGQGPRKEQPTESA